MTLAEHWNGTEWSIQTSANHEGTFNELYGVSCSSSTACTAVGVFTNSSSNHATLAEQWNGSEWKLQTTVNPSGNQGALLEADSCASSSACVAVGKYTTSGGKKVTLGEVYF